MTDNQRKNEIATLILGTFHLDKLCPKCGGPMERKNISSCDRCDLQLGVRVQLEMIETGCMSIRHKTGLSKKPIVHRTQQPKPKPAPKKTKVRKKKSTRKKSQSSITRKQAKK